MSCINVAAVSLLGCSLIAALLPLWALLSADLLRYGLCWRAIPTELAACSACCRCGASGGNPAGGLHSSHGTTADAAESGAGGVSDGWFAHARFFGTALDNANLQPEARDRVADTLAHQWIMLSGAIMLSGLQGATAMMQLVDPELKFQDSQLVAIRLLQYPLGWVPFAAGASMLMFGQMVRRRERGRPADDAGGLQGWWS